jgi:translation initiation factor 1 (eIF-1/SUI1)
MTEELENLVTIETEVDPLLVSLAINLACGNSIKNIAYELGRSEQWVRMHRKDREVVTIVNDLQKESIDQAKKILTHGSTKAANTMIDCMDSKNEAIKLAAARDFLDRNMIGVKQNPALQANIFLGDFLNMSKDERRKNLAQRITALRQGD